MWNAVGDTYKEVKNIKIHIKFDLKIHVISGKQSYDKIVPKR